MFQMIQNHISLKQLAGPGQTERAFSRLDLMNRLNSSVTFSSTQTFRPWKFFKHLVMEIGLFISVVRWLRTAKVEFYL